MVIYLIVSKSIPAAMPKQRPTPSGLQIYFSEGLLTSCQHKVWNKFQDFVKKIKNHE